QLNLAFRDPLTPELDGSDWRLLEPVPGGVPGGEPGADSVPGAAHPADSGTGPGACSGPGAGSGNGPGSRTVVLAGHGAGPSAEVFARSLGLPLLAEPSSNARYGPNAVGPYRLLLEHFGPLIGKVVVFGRPTLSRPVAALLARADLPRALYLPRPVAWFTPGRRPEQPVTDWAELIRFAGRGAEGWLGAWQQAGRAAEDVLDRELGDRLSGPAVARALWGRPGWDLVLGSSNPIRDADLAGRPGPAPAGTVFANRGLSGIDGTVATATGAALASGVPTRVLLGDLTLLHDAGSLLLGTGEREPALHLMVINDGGGGIFSTLEHGRLGATAPYGHVVERLFGTPHTADLSALAAAYGLGYRLAGSTAELADALAEPAAGRAILEVRVRREDLRPLHARIKAAVGAAVARSGAQA
ncbi:MAG: hypothetical protein ACHP7K_06105, partial [Actinomycetales bacterium]